jgi:hypothetical protein
MGSAATMAENARTIYADSRARERELLQQQIDALNRNVDTLRAKGRSWRLGVDVVGDVELREDGRAGPRHLEWSRLYCLLRYGFGAQECTTKAAMREMADRSLVRHLNEGVSDSDLACEAIALLEKLRPSGAEQLVSLLDIELQIGELKRRLGKAQPLIDSKECQLGPTEEYIGFPRDILNL